MYTLTSTKKVTIDRNLCDHIWVEEVFLTKIGAILKALAVHWDNERWVLNGTSDNVVREYHAQ